jgi:hypothetical protein
MVISLYLRNFLGEEDGVFNLLMKIDDFNFIGMSNYYRRLVRHNFDKITSPLKFIIGRNDIGFLLILIL